MIARLHTYLNRSSLRLRLLAGTLTWVVVALLCTGLVLVDLFQEHTARQFRTELLVHLDQLTANLEFQADGTPLLTQDLSDPRLKKPFSGMYWQVSNAKGTPLLRSRSLWDTVLTLPLSENTDSGELQEHHIQGPQDTNLLLLERTIFPAEQPEQQLRLQVAADEAPLATSAKNFTGILSLALVILALGLAGASIIQVRIGLAPLSRLRNRLSEIQQGRTRQLEGSFPSEIQPLVDEFNSVLQHDTEVLVRARTQAGNLAHALKTPLTILSHAAAREEGPLAKLVMEQVDTARRQIDYHLARARAAAAVQVPGLSTPVQASLAALIRVMERLHAERGLEIHLHCTPPDLGFRGETQDFQEILGNLLENACKWASTQVSVKAEAIPGKRLSISIEDDGPGLPEHERKTVFGRGSRADEETPGSGLGLAIVRDLAQLYGGEIELTQSPLGGLEAKLVLPASE